MRNLKRVIPISIGIVLAVYITICIILYFYQENLIFYPKKLVNNYQFNFEHDFEEISIKTEDGLNLNGLLFKTEPSKGLVFYLHGNAGAMDTWGGIANIYTELGYDIFILDYRGFGKSEGEISSEEQFFSDIDLAYHQIKKAYSEENIVIIGYSIGTGSAARLASKNKVKLLILQAPYYSLVDLMKQSYPFIPGFILKYKFETNKFIDNTKASIQIFHGNKDRVIYYGSSEKLKKHLKATDKLFTLEGQGHNGMNYNKKYLNTIKSLL